MKKPAPTSNRCFLCCGELNDKTFHDGVRTPHPSSGTVGFVHHEGFDESIRDVDESNVTIQFTNVFSVEFENLGRNVEPMRCEFARKSAKKNALFLFCKW